MKPSWDNIRWESPQQLDAAKNKKIVEDKLADNQRVMSKVKDQELAQDIVDAENQSEPEIRIPKIKKPAFVLKTFCRECGAQFDDRPKECHCGCEYFNRSKVYEQ